MSGTTELHWLQHELKGNGIKIDTHTYSEATTGVQDVINGRLDSFLADATPAKGFQKHYPDRLRIAGTVITSPPQVYALGVRKGDKKLLALLNKAAVHLYKSGKWQDIIHKYLPNATVTKVPGPMNRDIPSYKKPVPGLSQSQD